MPYSEEQIKRYLEILHNYTKPPERKPAKRQGVGIAKEMIVLLFTLDLKFAKTVVGKMNMF